MAPVLGLLLSFGCAAGLLLFAGFGAMMAKADAGDVYPPERFPIGRLIAIGATVLAALIAGYGLVLAWMAWFGG